MPRTLRERVRDPYWWFDQVLHFYLIGAPPAIFVLGCLRLGFPGCEVVGGGLAAFWVAGVREFEGRPVGSWGDLLCDIAFATAGGAVAGAAYMVIG